MRDFILTYLKRLTCIVAGILFTFYSYQFFFQDYDITVLIRAIFWLFYIPTVLIFGIRSIHYLFFIISNILLFSFDYRNYTYFFILLIFSLYKPKWKIPTFSLYFFEVLIAVFFHNNKDILNFIIHIMICSFFYIFTYLLQVEYYKSSHVELEPDEQKILEAMAQGKKQKEIDFFNKNTVTEKLKKARIRNNCGTTNELLIMYIISRHIGHNPIA